MLLDELRRARRVAATLIGDRPLSETLSELLSAAAGMGAIHLCSGDRTLALSAAAGLPRPYVDAIRELPSVPRDANACASAAASGQLVVVADTHTDPLGEPQGPRADAAGIRALYVLPLVTEDGRALGTWSRYFRAPHVPGAIEIEGARLQASLVVSALENERLRRAREESRREREESLRFITDAVPALISYIDTECRYQLANHTYQRWFHRDPDEIRGQHVRQVLGEDAWQAVRPYMERALTGEEVAYEQELPYQDGGARSVYVRYMPDRDAAGRIRGFVVFVHDMTERRAAEEALAAREAEFRAIFALAGVGMAQSDARTGRYTRVNPRFCEITGYSEAELLTRTALDLTHPEDRERDHKAFQPVFRGERDAWESEKRYVRKDGQIVWVTVTGHLVRDRQGEPSRTIASIVDITDRKRALEQLELGDRRKDEFIAMLAHELRNPLAPIRNGVHLLGRLAPRDEKLGRIRDTIDRQAAHMTRLVDDLLDVSRITRGKIILQEETLDLGGLTREVVSDHQPGFDQAGIHLEIRTPDVALWVHGDRTRLAQVLGNLLHNALKFSQAGGHTSVRLAAAGGAAVLEVEDDGVGIEPSVLPTLFEPFAQGNQSLDRSRGGLGLGLALVKGLAELHGGSVEARSEGVGHGARFTLRLPLVPPERTEAPADQAAGRAPQRRVLVVEDHVDTAATLEMLLTLVGHEVRVASSGSEALDLIGAWLPEVVICDIGLPGMDGYAVCRRLRQRLPRDRSLLVALTGYGQDEDVQRAKEAGFDLHLTKPFDPTVLEDIISRMA